MTRLMSVPLEPLAAARSAFPEGEGRARGGRPCAQL